MNELIINKDDLVHNINIIKNYEKDENYTIFAVVKGNAYGLGVNEFTKVLIDNGINNFAVASSTEAINLRKNIKEKIISNRKRKKEIKMTDNKVYLTDEGFLELEEELNELKNVKRPAVIKALKEARALGDLSENADYDAARTEQAQVEGRIQELEKIMENAHIIKKVSTDKVGLGTTVKIKYVDDDEIEEYRIVGSKEADPSNNKISNESPIAKAIMNAKVGEVKKVASPNGEYEVEIVEIC